MDDEQELVYIDADTEDFAKYLTLILKEVNSNIDCGETYEIIIHYLLNVMGEGVTEAQSIAVGKHIMKTTKHLTSKTKH